MEGVGEGDAARVGAGVALGAGVTHQPSRLEQVEQGLAGLSESSAINPCGAEEFARVSRICDTRTPARVENDWVRVGIAGLRVLVGVWRT